MSLELLSLLKKKIKIKKKVIHVWSTLNHSPTAGWAVSGTRSKAGRHFHTCARVQHMEEPLLSFECPSKQGMSAATGRRQGRTAHVWAMCEQPAPAWCQWRGQQPGPRALSACPGPRAARPLVGAMERPGASRASGGGARPVSEQHPRRAEAPRGGGCSRML